jgi:hypothetical protein
VRQYRTWTPILVDGVVSDVRNEGKHGKEAREGVVELAKAFVRVGSCQLS